MKKTLITAATLSVLGGASTLTHAQTTAQAILGGLAVNAQVATESEYIYRGKEHSDFNFQTNIRAEYTVPLPVGGLGLAVYGGTFSMQPVTQAANQLDFTLGAKLEYEAFTFDLGWIYHSFPNKNTVAHNWWGSPIPPIPGPTGGFQDSITNRPDYNRSNEFVLGLHTNLDGAILGDSRLGTRLSAFLYYDVNLEQFTYELDIARTFVLPMDPRASLTLKGFAGYVEAHRANGDQRAPGLVKWRNDYGYLGLYADIAYRLSEFTHVGTGIRYAWNSDGKSDLGYLAGNTTSNLWWGLWFRFDY